MRIIQLAGNGFAVLSSLLIFGLSVGSLSAQTVYKSVDDEGNVSFTDRPPLQQELGDKPLDVTAVEIQRSDRELIAANRKSTQSDARANGVAADIRAKHEAEDAAERAEKDELQAKNCTLAKERLTKYSQARRLYRESDDGERSYLSEQEIDTERANAVRAIDQWCGS